MRNDLPDLSGGVHVILYGGDHLREQYGLLDIHDAKKKVSLVPIFDPVDSAGIFDIRSRSHDDSQFDPNVPFNNKEREIAWLASHDVLAGHFPTTRSRTSAISARMSS